MGRAVYRILYTGFTRGGKFRIAPVAGIAPALPVYSSRLAHGVYTSRLSGSPLAQGFCHEVLHALPDSQAGFGVNSYFRDEFK